MSIYRRRLSDEQLSRWAMGLTGGLIAVGVPACLVTLTFVSPLQRIYIAVLSALLIVCVTALLVGTLRELGRLVRSVLAMVRLARRRRERAAALAGPEAVPA